MLTGVDHLVVRCSNPIDLLEVVSTALDVPIVIPAREYGDFCSGLIRVGNVDIEFARLGTETIPNPYFYGILFASAEGIWNTAAWLKKSRIPHTLPIPTTVERDGRPWGWSVIALKGFLDNPIPAPYSLGVLSGDGVTAKGASSVTNLLMKVRAIRRFMTRKGGDSICCVCHYDQPQELAGLRSMANEALAANGGGKNQIVGVDSIVIEANRSMTAWEKILPTKQMERPRLDIQPGATNRIREVVIKTKSSVPIPSMHFGDAVFSFQVE